MKNLIPSNIEMQARKEREKEELARKKDNEKLAVTDQIASLLTVICTAGNKVYAIFVRMQDLSNRIFELAKSNSEITNPRGMKTAAYVLSIIGFIALIPIDMALVRGFITLVLSLDMTAGYFWIALTKYILPPFLLCTGVVLAIFIKKEHGLMYWIAENWPGAIAGITVTVYLSTTLFEFDEIDHIVIATSLGLTVIAYAVHAIPMKMAPTLLKAGLWLHYRLFMRRALLRYVADFKMKSQSVMEPFGTWVKLHQDNEIDINMKQLPPHVRQIIDLYSQEDNQDGLEPSHTPVDLPDPPITGGDGTTATPYEVEVVIQ
ncbi:MAG: hypothetical protein AB8F95_20620 [Bacteroidia bacterium]